MNLNLDSLIVFCGLSSYVFFVVLQVFVLRFIKPEEIFRSLMQISAGAFVLHLALISLFWRPFFLLGFPQDQQIEVLSLSALLASFIFGTASFVHILCLLGPYETSIRFRLVRELFSSDINGLSLPGLLKRYNSEKILMIRLSRLTGSGDVVLRDDKYRVEKKTNVFFVIDSLSRIIQKIISGKK